jgi:hypothetical protein
MESETWAFIDESSVSSLRKGSVLRSTSRNWRPSDTAKNPRNLILDGKKGSP